MLIWLNGNPGATRHPTSCVILISPVLPGESARLQQSILNATDFQAIIRTYVVRTVPKLFVRGNQTVEGGLFYPLFFFVPEFYVHLTSIVSRISIAWVHIDKPFHRIIYSQQRQCRCRFNVLNIQPRLYRDNVCMLCPQWHIYYSCQFQFTLLL